MQVRYQAINFRRECEHPVKVIFVYFLATIVTYLGQPGRENILIIGSSNRELYLPLLSSLDSIHTDTDTKAFQVSETVGLQLWVGKNRLQGLAYKIIAVSATWC